MWRLIGQPKTQDVTKRLAQAISTMESPPRERPVSERRLQVYERIMREGGFRPVTWAKAYCKETGSTYRVNGQHTSLLMSRMAEEPGMQKFHATVEVYECATLDDVSRLYATFDSKTMSRTTADINRSFAACVPALEGLPNNAINLCVAGIAYSRYQEKYTNQTQPAGAGRRRCWSTPTSCGGSRRSVGETPGISRPTRTSSGWLWSRPCSSHIRSPRRRRRSFGRR